MNWGWKIVVIYSAFVIMTLAMVFYFMQQKVDLVAEDYYKQEIEYQEQIDKIANAKSLNESIGLEIESENRWIKISFPNEHIQQGIDGKIQLYRPSNSGEDREFALKPNASGEQVIAIGSLPRGLWKIKIFWSSNGKEFYEEKTITL